MPGKVSLRVSGAGTPDSTVRRILDLMRRGEALSGAT
jgi:hypothetical protein